MVRACTDARTCAAEALKPWLVYAYVSVPHVFVSSSLWSYRLWAAVPGFSQPNRTGKVAHLLIYELVQSGKRTSDTCKAENGCCAVTHCPPKHIWCFEVKCVVCCVCKLSHVQVCAKLWCLLLTPACLHAAAVHAEHELMTRVSFRRDSLPICTILDLLDARVSQIKLWT